MTYLGLLFVLTLITYIFYLLLKEAQILDGIFHIYVTIVLFWFIFATIDTILPLPYLPSHHISHTIENIDFIVVDNKFVNLNEELNQDIKEGSTIIVEKQQKSPIGLYVDWLPMYKYDVIGEELCQQ